MAILKPNSVIYADLGLQDNGPVHAFFTATCAKAMDKYVPFDTGSLAETVYVEGKTTRNVTTNTITYEQPYARYVYYGRSKYGAWLKYNKSKHEYAGAYWDKRMWTADKDKVVKQVQDFINRGGHNGK